MLRYIRALHVYFLYYIISSEIYSIKKKKKKIYVDVAIGKVPNLRTVPRVCLSKYNS